MFWCLQLSYARICIPLSHLPGMVGLRYIFLGGPLLSCCGLCHGVGVEPGRSIKSLFVKHQLIVRDKVNNIILDPSPIIDAKQSLVDSIPSLYSRAAFPAEFTLHHALVVGWIGRIDHEGLHIPPGALPLDLHVDEDLTVFDLGGWRCKGAGVGTGCSGIKVG
jgi:hypothetical protein